MDQIAAVSLEHDPVNVSVTKNGAAYNPTGDPVSFAYLRQPFDAASPQPTDAVTASWETSINPVGIPVYRANCLVGPNGDATLSRGLWYRWVKITDSPEVLWRPCGTLMVI